MATELSEHFPLAAFDEYPIHQSTEVLRVMATTDPRAYERYWFSAQDDAGEMFLVIGMGFYPNLETTDAYSIFVHKNKHTTVRAYRPVGQDRANMVVGPVSLQIVRPFREWRLTLGNNSEKLKYDLTWRDAKRAIFHRIALSMPDNPTVIDSQLFLSNVGYESFGTVEGTIEYQGRQFKLDASRVRGSRDHHWGIRDGVGGPGHQVSAPKGSHLGQWVEFRDWSIWGWRVLYNLGEPQGGATRIDPFEHKLRFDPITKHLVGGVIRNRLASGQVREVTYEQIGNQVAYLRCGMYTGPDGRGTPEEDYHHGSAVGESVAGETYDVSDAKVRMRIAGFDEHLCRVTCNGETAIGILECRNPVLYEMCRAKVPGFSLLDE